MRFDPDNMGPVGTRKKFRKKIDLSMKELVELRKADKHWVGPAEQKADLTKAEKETQVTLMDHMILLLW